jgi:hypothetical protein
MQWLKIKKKDKKSKMLNQFKLLLLVQKNIINGLVFLKYIPVIHFLLLESLINIQFNSKTFIYINVFGCK